MSHAFFVSSCSSSDKRTNKPNQPLLSFSSPFPFLPSSFRPLFFSLLHPHFTCTLFTSFLSAHHSRFLSLSSRTLFTIYPPFFAPFNCCAHNIIHTRSYPTPLLASALIP